MKNSIFKNTLISITCSFLLIACGSGENSSDNIDEYPQNIEQSDPIPKIYNTPKGIHINEILSSNLKTVLDKDFYQFSDWIELYNNSSNKIDISGYYLSDDKENLKKWQIPQHTTVPANGYLLIWADKKDIKQKELHTNFKLSSKKERLIFCDSNAKIIDNIEFKDQQSDISLVTNGKDYYYMNPTPNAPNSQTYTKNKRSKTPNFSINSSFLYSATPITITADDSAKIYYTIDGSIPTKRSKLYDSSIDIANTSVIKAISIENDKFPSLIKTASYFINQSSNLPTVSLSLDPKYLYDDMIGIYVDGNNGIPHPHCGHDDNQRHNFAQNWDRPSVFEYFDESGKSGFLIGSNISISGQCSRYNEKKSFSFDFNSKYKNTPIDYKLYDSKDITKIKDLKLRTGNLGYEIGDILAANLVSDGGLDIDYQAFKTTRVFINGEYWGVYNIREKKNDNFIKANYPDVKKSKVDIIKNSSIAKHGSIDEYKKLLNASSYQEIVNLIDIDNFIDYITIMIYSGNEDWSYSNCRAWKEKKDGAKWRWMLDDLDEGFNTYNSINADLLNGDYGLKNGEHELSKIFNILMQNPATKTKFKNRVTHLLDTTFSPITVNRIIREIINKRVDYMPSKEPNKWFIGEEGYSTLIHDYETYKNMLNEFANRRRNIVKSQIELF